MNVPVEIVVWMLASIFGVASVGVHLLVRINGTMNKLERASAVTHAKMELRLEALERHRVNNEEELSWMRTHVERRLATSAGG